MKINRAIKTSIENPNIAKPKKARINKGLIMRAWRVYDFFQSLNDSVSRRGRRPIQRPRFSEEDLRKFLARLQDDEDESGGGGSSRGLRGEQQKRESEMGLKAIGSRMSR